MQPYVVQDTRVDPTIPLGQFIDDVFWPAKQDLRESTKKGYRRDIKRIVEVLGHVPLIDVTHIAIQFLVSQGSTTKMAKNSRETLSNILSYACEIGTLRENHASGRFRYPDTAPTVKAFDQGAVLATFEEIYDFLQVARWTDNGNQIERTCLLGLCFGLRASEIFGVNGADFLFDEYALDINSTYVKTDDGWKLLRPKTDCSIRRVPFVNYAFKRILEIGIDNPYAWINNTLGERAKEPSVAKAFAKWRDRYGLPAVTIGSMRHSFATSCIAAGIDVNDVASWLGHSDPSLSRTSYIRPNFKSLCRDTKIIDAKLRPRESTIELPIAC